MGRRIGRSIRWWRATGDISWRLLVTRIKIRDTHQLGYTASRGSVACGSLTGGINVHAIKHAMSSW